MLKTMPCQERQLLHAVSRVKNLQVQNGRRPHTLHHSRVVGRKSDTLVSDLNMDSWCKVDTPKQLIQRPRRRSYSSEDWAFIGRHFYSVGGRAGRGLRQISNVQNFSLYKIKQ